MNDQSNGHEPSALFDLYTRALRAANHPEALRLRVQLMALARKPPRPEPEGEITRPPRSPGAAARRSRAKRF
jgi:hypothetical protein